MAWLDTLKGLVVEDDKPTVAQTPAQVGAKPLASGAPVSYAQQDNEFVPALRNAIKQRPTAFTALLANADKLSSVIPDQNMRLKAAFEMVKGEGRGMNELLQAIEIHAGDLASQERQFDAAMDKQKTVAVGAMTNELAGLEPSSANARQQLEALARQAQALNELISSNTTKAGELTMKIQAEERRFVEAKQRFTMALQVVQAELQGQKLAISSTLS
jgi:predicted  nucleic acid-binding Zn-ribbon protein